MLGWRDDRQLATLLPAKPARRIAAALGSPTVSALLEHYPRDWSHHGSGVDIGGAQIDDTVTILGEVIASSSSYTARGQYLYTVVVSDGYNQIKATFFNGKYVARQLVQGCRAMLCGKLKAWGRQLQLSHPAFVILPQPGTRHMATGGLKQLSAYGDADYIDEILSHLDYLPIYPTKKGTTSWEVLGAVDLVLKHLDPIPEPLDEPPADMVSFDAAIRGIHQPDERGPEPFITRIKYNEALSLALVLALSRADNERHTAPVIRKSRAKNTLNAKLRAALPFTPTKGQDEVLDEIVADMGQSTPMMRLLQGEVGSGKTLVALQAMLTCVQAGRQAALLAPTEVLATQHAQSMQKQLTAAGLQNVKVTLVTGSQDTATRRQVLLDCMSGESNIIIGTHALIYDQVQFFDLGLVVVDEQHRFGVEQRDRLRAKRDDGLYPHLLVMTATPIPRTMAMTFFGDLDISTLKELPGGRRAIDTVVVPDSRPTWVQRAWQRIDEEIAAGSQAFVVCPTIEGEGGAIDTAHFLRETVFPQHRIGLVHSKLPAVEKEQVMADFAAGHTDILVSTTVIEVGIDVPNATVMYIRHADRFGISQLHQLRGRVGRGTKKSLCLLHTTAAPDTPTYERLTAVANTADGFALAEIDLRTRREGNILGTEQSGGKRRVRLLDLTTDGELIARATRDATALVARNRALAEHLTSDFADEERDFIDKS